MPLTKWELDHDWWAGFLVVCALVIVAATILIGIKIAADGNSVRAHEEGKTLRVQISECSNVDVRDRADCIERATKR